jgi:phosphopantothenoylcysteine synthetase/decarboxylase
MNLLVGITGSIGAIEMPIYLSVLKERFSNLRVIMTQSAECFIPKETFSLIADEVYTQMFPIGSTQLSHVQLARWAHLLIVLPCTAHTIAQVAGGFAGSLLTATILAHTNPVLFFPNMNDAMWQNPATQRNLSLLKEYGHVVVPPIQKNGYEHASKQKKMGGFMPSPIELLEVLQTEIEKRKEYVHL